MADVHSKETRSYRYHRGELIKAKKTNPEMLVRVFFMQTDTGYKFHD